MGEPVTPNAATYGSNYSVKHQNSSFSVYCFILQILPEIIMRLLYYSIAKKINCQRFSRIFYFNPTKTEVFIDTICSQFAQLPRVTLNYDIFDFTFLGTEQC